MKYSFDNLKLDYNNFVLTNTKKFSRDEVIKIDLHCHDKNSDKPDEIFGRLLKVRESWLETEKLYNTLKSRNCDVITITNHNNAKSCYQLQNKYDNILTGAEFTCYVPDFKIYIHVLVYGFNLSQEQKLNRLRRDLYDFLKYSKKEDLPTILAHPLFFRSLESDVPLEFFEKMFVVFENFEVINGQRNLWQNMLTKAWLDELNREKIDTLAHKFNLDPQEYCKNPYKKNYCGGSDDHMGIFAGLSGSYLHVKNLAQRKKKESLANLALEALRNGDILAYGPEEFDTNMSVAFLIYLSQLALNYEDPGLIRFLLHKGTIKDKFYSFLMGNFFSELKYHKTTINFLTLFHNAINGEKINIFQKYFIPKDYRKIFNILQQISTLKKENDKLIISKINQNIEKIYKELIKIGFSRLEKKIQKHLVNFNSNKEDFNKILEKLELPFSIRAYLEKTNSTTPLKEFLDNLSFPFFSSLIILGATYINNKVLYSSRILLNKISENIKKYKFPSRLLWLTDTYNDKNGVSYSIKAMLEIIQLYNLPIDIVVCNNNIKSENNLIALKPVLELDIPFYKEQKIRIPNLLELDRLVLINKYDKIICSTEGPMGIAGLYLKNAYNLKGYFFLHTDWYKYLVYNFNLTTKNKGMIRRFLRLFYGTFDAAFVLNNDQKRYFEEKKLTYKNIEVYKTHWWINKEIFKPLNTTKKEIFNIKNSTKIILYSGRLSKEKGIFDVIELYSKLKDKIDNLLFVIVGSGPEENRMKRLMPKALFYQWINQEELTKIYNASDLLIMPSKFDTFGRVILEAISCGLPVIAYNTKGPKEILENQKCGFLVNNLNKMELLIEEYFTNNFLKKRELFKKNCLERAKFFNREKIIKNFLINVGLQDEIDKIK